MLARRVVPLDDRILGPAPEIDPEAAADLVLRLYAFGHDGPVVTARERRWVEPRRYSDRSPLVKSLDRVARAAPWGIAPGAASLLAYPP
jgi:hypothetical protein